MEKIQTSLLPLNTNVTNIKNNKPPPPVGEENEKTLSMSNKKNGRKAKGAKLINKNGILKTEDASTTNVVLHLQCSMNDLCDYNDNLNKQITDPTLYTPSIPPDIQTYNNTTQHNYVSYNNKSYDEDIAATSLLKNEQIAYPYICSICNATIGGGEENTKKNTETTKYPPPLNSLYTFPVKNEPKLLSLETNSVASTIKECPKPPEDRWSVREKVIEMKSLLQSNQLNKKRSACFWCTCEFENMDFGIPLDDDSQYGCFCTPECAVAFLMKEQIDDSVKFERYHLLNQRYGKMYSYTDNIKPAPNPHYTLDKFYGNMTIIEYRKLLQSNNSIIIVEKPITRIFPEIYDEQIKTGLQNNHTKKDDVTSGITPQYKVKRVEDKPAKKNNNIFKNE